MENNELLTPAKFAAKHNISHVYVYQLIKGYPESVTKYRGKHECLRNFEVVRVAGKPYINEK
jgi:hypothetical protein